MIAKFKGRYDYLSNFYEASMYMYDDVLNKICCYRTVEHWFQSQKTLNPAQRQFIINCDTPGVAKKLGRSCHLRPDWEEVKIKVMYQGLRSKFEQHKNLKKRLLNTRDHYLIEGNYWHDNYWGICDCNKCKDIKGENHLGQLLMILRKELLEEV